MAVFGHSDERKMCVVVQHYLGKGDPLRAPVASPPACGWSQGIKPVSQPAERFAAQPRARRLRSPCTHDQRGYRAPLKPTRRTWRRPSPPAPNHRQPADRLISDQGSVPAAPDTPMTTSWRRLSRDQEGSMSWLPFLETFPSTNPAQIGCRQYRIRLRIAASLSSYSASLI